MSTEKNIYQQKVRKIYISKNWERKTNEQCNKKCNSTNTKKLKKLSKAN